MVSILTDALSMSSGIGGAFYFFGNFEKLVGIKVSFECVTNYGTFIENPLSL
jgi:hypothetical protein